MNAVEDSSRVCFCKTLKWITKNPTFQTFIVLNKKNINWHLTKESVTGENWVTCITYIQNDHWSYINSEPKIRVRHLGEGGREKLHLTGKNLLQVQSQHSAVSIVEGKWGETAEGRGGDRGRRREQEQMNDELRSKCCQSKVFNCK